MAMLCDKAQGVLRELVDHQREDRMAVLTRTIFRTFAFALGHQSAEARHR